PQVSFGHDEQVAQNNDECFPAADIERVEEWFLGEQGIARQSGFAAAIVDRTFLRDEGGTLLEKDLERIGGGDRRRAQARFQASPKPPYPGGGQGTRDGCRRTRHAGSRELSWDSKFL